MRAAWWWIDRWRKSTAYMRMTPEEQGLYRNLLDAIWLFEGPIPNEPKTLLAAACCDPIEWERSGAKVLQWFRLTKEGWVNDTAMEVMEKTKHRQAVRSVAGKAGAEVRWPKHSKRHGKAEANAITNVLTKSCPPDPDPDPDPKPSPEEEKTGRASPSLVRAFDAFWAIYPRKAGKAAAEKVWTRLHPSERLAALICEAVERQKTWEQWTKDGGRFIPHPATWLNQGRWDDEPTNPAVSRVSDRTRANQAAGAAFVARVRGQS